MKHVQTVLDDKEFENLRLFCSLTGTTLKDLMRNLALNFLCSDKYEKIVSYSEGLSKLGNEVLDDLSTDKLKQLSD